jgi:hypothetical protein
MTTYVLGAGASVHAGYPLARNLGSSLLHWLQQGKLRNAATDYCANLQQVSDLYGGLDNLEEIVADLDDPKPESPAASFRRSVRSTLLDSVRIPIPEYFHDLLLSRSAPLYREFATTKARPDDTIITFNYDIACERELKRAGLWEIGTGYGFPLGIDQIPSSQVQVLKLHGSVNWLMMVLGGMLNGQFNPAETLNVVIYGSRQFESLGYPPELSDSACKFVNFPGGRPALVMGFRKRFFSETSFGRELEDFWQCLWSQAEVALGSSDEIAVIGYSLPIADERARELLLEKANRSAQITICCGERSSHVSHEFERHGFSHIETMGGGRFEDYLGVSL